MSEHHTGMSREEMEENIISAHEAADLLGITQRAVTGLLERGTLIGKKLGREWAIDKASVLEYLRRKKGKTPA